MAEEEIIEMVNQALPPCVLMLGGKVIDVDPETGLTTMTFFAKPEFCHSGTVLQGGFITAMLDAAMSHAAMIKSGFTLSPPTLQITVRFFTSGSPGQFTCTARVNRMGNSIAFLEGSLFNEQNETVATAVSTARLVPMK